MSRQNKENAPAFTADAFESFLSERDFSEAVKLQLRELSEDKKTALLTSRTPAMSMSRQTSFMAQTLGSRSISSGKLKNIVAPSAAAAALDSPEKWLMFLKTSEPTTVQLDRLSKLRILLGASSPDWIQTFIRYSGCLAIQSQLLVLLKLEWREEQHDDQALLEYLRCMKALSTTSSGLSALLQDARSSPLWPAIVRLLQSDKKPGELACRKVMIELLQRLCSQDPSYLLSLVRDKGDDSTVDFVLQARKQRPFKSLVNEMAEVERDFFWVFGHADNPVWAYEQTDEEKVCRFRVPGGMTGGVEFEAMSYFTTYLSMINQLCCTLSAEESISLHAGLWDSGLDRVLWTGRKASLIHYPTLHFQFSKYIHLAQIAGQTIPYALLRIISTPPEAVRLERDRSKSWDYNGACNRSGNTDGGGTPIASKFIKRCPPWETGGQPSSANS